MKIFIEHHYYLYLCLFIEHHHYLFILIVTLILEQLSIFIKGKDLKSKLLDEF